MVKMCEPCFRTKPNKQEDRGIVGMLPIPQVANSTVHLDFIEVDRFAEMNYILVTVDATTGYVQAWPTTKKITGERALKLFLERWAQVYGMPLEVMHDNDV